MRELIELGFADALAATGIETTVLGYYNEHGQLIWAEPRGRAAGYEWPQYAISRGDLQMILLTAVSACRFSLVLLAASAGRDGITGLSIWMALALAAYIIGLSYLARKESTLAAVSLWPCLFLAVPLMLALIVNQGEFPSSVRWCCARRWDSGCCAA